MNDSIFNTDEWAAAYERLKAKAAEFTRLYQDLGNFDSLAASNPDVARRRQKLLDRGNVIYSTLENIRSFANTIYNAGESWGLNGLAGQHLGLFWIPIAAVVSAIGAITYWITDAKKEIEEFRLIEQLQNEGYSTSQAIEKARGAQPLTEVKRAVMWGVGGLLGFFILKRIWK